MMTTLGDDFGTYAPMMRSDLTIRRVDDEMMVWPAGGSPLHLDAVGAVVVQLLDGEVSMAELADDIVDVVGIPRSMALQRLRTLTASLFAAGALSDFVAEPRPSRPDRLLYGPLNP